MSSLTLYAAPAVEPLTVAEVAQRARIDSMNQEVPPSAFTAALAATPIAGNVNAGVHRYLATFVTADGETQAGGVSAPATVVDAGVNGKVELSAIPIGGSLVTARKLYRTAANGSTYLLLTTLANNTATTYTDNIADASLGVQAPTTNTTGDPELNALIKAVRHAAEGYTRRALVTQTWDLKLDRFPCWTINVPKPTLQSVTSITYVDTDGNTQTLAADQYLVDTSSEPARITPVFGGIWPVTRWQNNAVTVRFVAGYGLAATVPDGIKTWMIIRIKHLFDNPDAIVTGARNQAAEMPRALVDGMLDEYTVPDFTWEH